MSHPSRRTVLAVALVPWAAGCTSQPLRPLQADGTYCYATGMGIRKTRTCTTQPIPTVGLEQEAKLFRADEAMLTVYVIRKGLLDSANQVVLAVDDRHRIVTVPRSFVRFRLRPGTHRVQINWDTGSSIIETAGSAGELQFLELLGASWSWGATYRLEAANPEAGRHHAARLVLLADIRDP